MSPQVLLHVVAAAAVTAGAASSPPAPTCPDGGQWYGHAPPHGYEYYCGIEQGGTLVKHGWSVSYHGNGKVKQACEYRHGELDGRCSTYGENGALRTRGMHRGGLPVGFHWFFDVRLGDASKPHARRKLLEGVFTEFKLLGVDVDVLAQHILDHCDSALDDIRNAPQVCTPLLCVSAATIDGQIVIALQSDPPAEKVEAGAAAYRVAKARAVEQKAAEEKAAKLRQKKYEKAVREYERKARAWANTRLQCNDGTRSPSCVCGGGHRGCCSHHGGVAGCPREYPEPPAPLDD